MKVWEILKCLDKSEKFGVADVYGAQYRVEGTETSWAQRMKEELGFFLQASGSPSLIFPEGRWVSIVSGHRNHLGNLF